MDANTGRIYLDVPDDEAKKRKLVPIPKDEAETVINMNRKQRRAWAARQRKAARATESESTDGGTDGSAK